MENRLIPQTTYNRWNSSTKVTIRIVVLTRTDLGHKNRYVRLVPMDHLQRRKITPIKRSPYLNPATGGASFLSMEELVDEGGQSRVILCASETMTYGSLGVLATLEDKPPEEQLNPAESF